MRIILLVIMALAWPYSAQAIDRCSTIDLSGDLGDTWDQVDTSWCHAFSTTDALTKRLRNLGFLKKGERLHPLQIAAALPLAQNQSVVRSTRQLGTMADDMVALSQAETAPGKRPNEGLCREGDLAPSESRARAIFNEDWKLASKMFARPESPENSTSCLLNQNPFQSVKAVCDHFERNESKYWSDLFEKKCSLPWPDWHVSYRFNPSRIDWMNSQKTLEPFSPRIDGEMKSSIDAALESNELAAIGYDVRFLRKSKGKPESHWSTVTGRKRDADGKCYYTLRNSWGPDCKFYSALAKCEKGFLTIPEEELLPRVHTVHYFD